MGWDVSQRHKSRRVTDEIVTFTSCENLAVTAMKYVRNHLKYADGLTIILFQAQVFRSLRYYHGLGKQFVSLANSSKQEVPTADASSSCAISMLKTSKSKIILLAA
ncbi:uncharacterized protein PHALS_06324 [Plasmopara halstedii]|uniref:Uncharacterized protein n=1 Tax=Plasmopara halstedii TaxID=4781 RepID=A0A0P1B237_PLAHL|nr:uncharacterized protein PHALS_06324 [Plasmopara halstedii]CEG48505.1 hypothetical protein PHALS_06324 [Plasmopara halstedii]|eukprot:XP_024584874.1 hypothetical protein PHALS_06324 [Plasmopara halstedii]